MVGRIIQLIFGAGLVVWSGIGMRPMLLEPEEAITMAGVLYLGIFLVGLDIFGRAIRR
ncbi:unnamed protein product [marine sediment metagenome]|uniref:Uncharacterized protein n=1 Tax=marine sediment metagenome TaxID=412755 RepID=X1HUN0_9ZZZZ